MQKIGFSPLILVALGFLTQNLFAIETQIQPPVAPQGIARNGMSAAEAAESANRASQQAIAAAAQAGMMYRILMAKGIMDYFQRKEMDKALENLNKKLETIKKEAAAGKIGPTQYAAIKAAVDEAYAQNAKMEAPKDKEIAPDLKLENGKNNLNFNESGNLDSSLKRNEEKTALQAQDVLQPQNLESTEPKNSLEAKQTSPSSESKKEGDFGSPSGSPQPLLVSDRINPVAQNLAIHNSAESDSSSKDKMAETKIQMNLEKDFNHEMGSERGVESTGVVLTQGDFEEGGTPIQGEKKNSSELQRAKTEAYFAGGMGHWLKPPNFTLKKGSTL